MRLQRPTFVNKYHDHILKGDLRIVKNSKLRKVICKRPRFREKNPTNFREAKKNILKGLDDFNSTWCEQKALRIAELMEWGGGVLV